MNFRATTIRNVSFPSGSTVQFDQAVGDAVLRVGYATIYTLGSVSNALLKSKTGVFISISAVAGTTVTATIVSNPSGRTIAATDVCEMGVGSVIGSTELPVVISDPGIDPLLVTSSTFFVSATKAASWVMAEFGLTVTGSVADSGALRAIVAQSDNGGASAIRAGEFHALRVAPAGAAGVWILELGLHSSVVGNGTTRNVGIYLSSSEAGWLTAATGLRGDTGLLITGELGWTHAIRYYDTDGATVLFDVDQNGSLTMKGTPTADVGNIHIVSKANNVGLSFYTASGNAAARHWQMQANYAALGDFALMVGAAQGAVPTSPAIYSTSGAIVGIGTFAVSANTRLTILKGATSYIEFPTADATDPTGGGGAAIGRLPIIVNGVLRYLPYY